jgi:hypothetical protein
MLLNTENLFLLPGVEPDSLSHPACSPSLYWMSYPSSCMGNFMII